MVGMNDVGNTNTVLLIWTIISGIVGISGFLLAFYLMIQEWHRYHLPLHMTLREVKYRQSYSLGDTHLVLLSLAFVNPSSAGRTVFHILGGGRDIIDLKPYPYRRMEGQSEIELITPNGGMKLKVPIPELFWLPLDIPPHQSRTRWYPALIQTKQGVGVNQSQQVHIHLTVKDVLGKELASIDQKIELKTYVLS